MSFNIRKIADCSIAVLNGVRFLTNDLSFIHYHYRFQCPFFLSFSSLFLVPFVHFCCPHALRLCSLLYVFHASSSSADEFLDIILLSWPRSQTLNPLRLSCFTHTRHSVVANRLRIKRPCVVVELVSQPSPGSPDKIRSPYRH